MTVANALRAAIHAHLHDLSETSYRTESWHSATFAGKRVILDLVWDAPVADVAAFASMLSEHEFAQPDLLVADISVARQTCAADDAVVLTIEALLLGDEA